MSLLMLMENNYFPPYGFARMAHMRIICLSDVNHKVAVTKLSIIFIYIKQVSIILLFD